MPSLLDLEEEEPAVRELAKDKEAWCGRRPSDCGSHGARAARTAGCEPPGAGPARKPGSCRSAREDLSGDPAASDTEPLTVGRGGHTDRNGLGLKNVKLPARETAFTLPLQQRIVMYYIMIVNLCS